MIALFFGWEVFFPVAIISLIGGFICIASTQICVGQLTAELIQDLVSADKDRLDLVLAVLTETERDWFLAELPRAGAELQRRQERYRADWRVSVRWGWRLLYS
jgi:hypothetical protein